MLRTYLRLSMFKMSFNLVFLWGNRGKVTIPHMFCEGCLFLTLSYSEGSTPC